MAWHKTGDDGNSAIDAESDRQHRAREEAKKNKFRRFWLPAGGEGRVTFMDDLKSPHGFDMPYVYLEHQLHLDGHWRNWYTCLAEADSSDPEKVITDKCPLCKSGDTPSVVAAYMVVNHSEWKDRKGNIHKNEINLFVCKTQVAKVLRKAMKKKGGLRGWTVEVSRVDDNSPNTGDQFDFEEKLSDEEFKSKYGIELPQPADYREILAEKSEEELRKILGGVEANDDMVGF